jgi:hypothetical protein
MMNNRLSTFEPGLVLCRLRAVFRGQRGHANEKDRRAYCPTARIVVLRGRLVGLPLKLESSYRYRLSKFSKECRRQVVTLRVPCEQQSHLENNFLYCVVITDWWGAPNLSSSGYEYSLSHRLHAHQRQVTHSLPRNFAYPLSHLQRYLNLRLVARLGLRHSSVQARSSSFFVPSAGYRSSKFE